MSFAARLVSTMDTLLVATLLAALYPQLAAAVAPQRRERLRALVGNGVGVLVAVLAPVAVVFALVAAPIVRLVFGHGAFDDGAVATTATVASVLALGLPALAVREVAARTAYALGAGGIAVRSALAAMAVNVAGDLLLAPLFGVAGIASATVASGVVAAVLTVWGLHRSHRAMPPLVRPLLGIAVAAVVAVPGGLWCREVFDDRLPGVAGELLVVGSVGVAVATAYLVALRLLAPREFGLLAQAPAVLRSNRGG